MTRYTWQAHRAGQFWATDRNVSGGASLCEARKALWEHGFPMDTAHIAAFQLGSLSPFPRPATA